jgi:universal stress protein E
MRSIHRILVAVKDPAVRSSPAIVKGAQLARALHAELVLFHAISAPACLNADISLLGNGLVDVETCAREDCHKRLAAIARRLRNGIAKVTISAECDYPIYEAVLRESTRIRADLIVAERHAGWHSPRGLLHLTDWELLRLSRVPVLLVQRGGEYRHPAIVGAVDPGRRDSKPLQLDRNILLLGSRMAAALHGQLHAVHAYVPVPVDAYAHGTTKEAVTRIQAETANNATRRLRHLARSVKLGKARLHVLGRHAPDAIEQVAAETRASIVVMGVISRQRVAHLLFGSTAERVLDHLSCDLLVVKPDGQINPLPRARRGLPYFHVANAT